MTIQSLQAHFFNTTGHRRAPRQLRRVACLCAAMLFGAAGDMTMAGNRDSSLPPPGECPQPRFTDKAPETFLQMHNPLLHEKRNLKHGEALYQSDAKPLPCMRCHGQKGNGKGIMAAQFNPPPRNFACAETVNGIPDGQLFWIIQNGSPGTSMPAFHGLNDEQIWQLVLYLRHLAGNM